MNDKSHAATPATNPIDQPCPELGLGIQCDVTAQAHAETVGERLKRLYPEHYVTILTYATRDGGAEYTAELLGLEAKGMYARPLEFMFLWESTSEGRDFWAKLAERERS